MIKRKSRVKKKRMSMGKLKEKADKTVQDSYRRNHQGKLCEICLMRPYDVIHHFIWKSQSNYLRYEPKNYIFVCKTCHCKFHIEHDQIITLRVGQLRGPEWVRWIEEHKRLVKLDNRKEIEGIIVYYESN